MNAFINVTSLSLDIDEESFGACYSLKEEDKNLRPRRNCVRRSGVDSVVGKVSRALRGRYGK